MKKEAPILHVIVLVRGYVGETHTPHYAYVRMTDENYARYVEAEKLGIVAIDNFGEVLAHGDSLTPPEGVVAEMKEKYGTDAKFTETLLSGPQ